MNYSTGKYQNFYWIEFGSSDFDLIALIKKMPNLIIGKYLGIVCFDGGVFKLTEEELQRGWHTNNEISFSQIINKSELNGAIYEYHDQWCLFKEQTKFEKMTDFVNYGRFSLKDRSYELDENEYIKSLQNKFWNEVENIKPFNVIINGDFFIFCTKDEKEIKEIITVANTVYS